MINTQTKQKPITVIGHGKKGSDIEGYTIFKNHDEELVAKIKAVTISENTFEYYGFNYPECHGTCKIEQELDGQLMCIGPNKKRFFLDPEEYKEMRKEELLKKINTLYPVYKHFNENFGEVIGATKITLFDKSKNKSDLFNRYDDQISIESELKINDYDEDIFSIYYSNEFGGSIMFCFFDENGNYVNRDYNVDIVGMSKEKPKTHADIIKMINKKLTCNTYQFYDNTWYTDNYAFRIEQIEEDDDDYNDNDDNSDNEAESFVYKKIGFTMTRYKYNPNTKKYGKTYDKVKKPKNPIIHTKEQVMEYILPIINQMNLPQ
jgi:hypothetical protein